MSTDVTEVEKSLNAERNANELYNFIVELEDEHFCMPLAVCEIEAKSSSGTKNEIEKKALRYFK